MLQKDVLCFDLQLRDSSVQHRKKMQRIVQRNESQLINLRICCFFYYRMMASTLQKQSFQKQAQIFLNQVRFSCIKQKNLPMG